MPASLTHLLPLYRYLPPAARHWAASLYGYQLRKWRFGPETERLVEEALDRERWSASRLRRWSEERLAYTLYHAAHNVPYYRLYWSHRLHLGDRRSPEYLENWPVLEKEQIRRDPRTFLADGTNPGRIHLEETSGTTGTPLRLWEGRESARAWYALAEARWRRWYGVSFQTRWALLGGKLVASASQRTPPYWAWNRGLNQLYISSYHLSSACVPHILDALDHYGVEYLSGYTASLNALAAEALHLGRRLPMRVVIPEAEPVLDHQRACIEAAFACRVRQTYGMTEHVGAASECEHGRLHLWPEAGWTEVLNGGIPVPRGQSGDLVFTGFLNNAMPLVRYRVGDRASLGVDRSCRCGRTLPLVQSLDGRVADILRTPDGRMLSSNAVDIIFGSDMPMREAQIVQTTLSDLVVRVVPVDGFDSAVEARMAHALRERMGAVNVTVERMQAIPRGPNGKFKVVVSEIATSSALPAVPVLSNLRP